MVAKGREGWTGSLGLVDANLHLEWISNEVVLYSTGNCIQCPEIDHDGKLYEEKNVYVYMYDWVTVLYIRT